ncbi:hypothetical protein F5Y17DRAFT_413201 [Xylariaceae sp. FL0594]|nr:hypothetical protein F5Y17DRAFT_413201 [Xylariaceae sp. FL0594]
MGLVKKLGVLLVAPALFVGVQFAYNQYMLTSLTYTLDPISPDDYVFDSELYRTLFNHTKWAHVDSFAVGVTVPLASLPPQFRGDEEAFGEEVMTQLWDQRLVTQFSRQPTGTMPKMGDASVSEALAVQVVSTGPKDMSIALVSRPRKNQLPMGFEHVMASFDREHGMAIAMIRYIWHARTDTPPSWRKSLARWSQINGRRQWLLRAANAIADKGKDEPVKLEL